ncbi:hypothetical protein CPC08DRAFT_821378 [Agrocybe pediades]|nr:hypothetical protein CPC08DRAFT_821378 [Agrocybe pediades]
MGSAQSYMSSEAAITALVVAGAVGLGYKQITSSSGTPASPTPAGTPAEGSGSTSKKGKKKQKKSAAAGDTSETLTASQSQSVPPARVVAFPEVIPGQFDEPPIPNSTDAFSTPEPGTSSKSKKPKKKSKGKQAAAVADAGVSQATPVVPQELASDSSATLSKSKAKKRQSAAQQQRQQTQKSSVPSASSSQLSRPLQQSTASLDTDGSWTRVGSHRHATDADSSAPSGEVDPATSDAGITTSVTGNSSPVRERREESTGTEGEGEGEGDDNDSFLLSVNTGSHRSSGDNRRTLAEKLLPKPRKTGVDDMLETSDFPTIARVMRVKPRPDEKPASGFSWGDYEDVRVVTDGGENDADGEDDGWGVVTSKRSKRTTSSSATPSSSTHVQKAPETTTKKQRQNAQRREQEKATKAAAELERQAKLAKHKRELEKAKMLEQYSTKSGGKAPSGGMKATLDERGKLVWE